MTNKQNYLKIMENMTNQQTHLSNNSIDCDKAYIILKLHLSVIKDIIISQRMALL